MVNQGLLVSVTQSLVLVNGSFIIVRPIGNCQIVLMMLVLFGWITNPRFMCLIVGNKQQYSGLNNGMVIWWYMMGLYDGYIYIYKYGVMSW